MQKLVVLMLASLMCGSCRNQGNDAPSHRTERERDSLLGQSTLPGARGVQGALRISDTAQARRDALDSAASR